MYDLIIRNATIIDGTGRDAYVSDLGITGDRIVKIGDLKQVSAGQVIDADGKTVTPGFIEPHSHADMTVLFHPTQEAYVMQGVTTVVTGNCGHAMAPMGEKVYRTAVDADRSVTAPLKPEFFGGLPPLFIEQEKVAAGLKERFDVELDWHSFAEFNRKCDTLPLDCNFAPLIGHSAIRNTVMGMDCRREATEEEIRQMEALTRTCMEQGAFGFSTGQDPTYEPSVYGSDEEVIRLLKIVKAYDGIFASHTANFVNGTFDRKSGYEEFFRHVKGAGIRANISHVQLETDDGDTEKAVKEAKELIAWLEQLAAEGMDLSYDIIPIADSNLVLCPYLASVFAPFVQMLGSRKRLAECLAVPDFRKMIRVVAESGMLPSIDTRNSDGIFGRFHVTSYHGAPLGQPSAETECSMIGKIIADLARVQHMDPLEYAMDLLVQDPDTQCGMSFQPGREAYELLFDHPMAMPCLDNSSSDKDADYSICPELPEYPVPFYYNGMITYLLHSKRTRFEDTVRSMTGFVAERFDIPERGMIAEGYFADLVIFDRKLLKSYSEVFTERRYPDGINYVIVNGKISVQDGVHLGEGAGRVLEKRCKKQQSNHTAIR